jgi:hypothetical protein
VHASQSEPVVRSLNISEEELRRASLFNEKCDFDRGDRSQEQALNHQYGVAAYWARFNDMVPTTIRFWNRN